MNFYPAFAWLRHRFHAGGTAGHGVHSPFIYDFLTTVLRNKTPGDIVRHVESLRREMLSDKRIISVTDLGAGSLKMTGAERSVADIARLAALPMREAGLLARIAWSLEHGAWSMEQEARGKEQGACCMEQGARGKEQRAWSLGTYSKEIARWVRQPAERGQTVRSRKPGRWTDGHGASEEQGTREPRRGDIMIDERAHTPPISDGETQSSVQAEWGMEPGARSGEHGASEEQGMREPRRGDIMIDEVAHTHLHPDGVTQGIFLELGTSLGISTLAIALSAPRRSVVTVEGCPRISEIAKSNLERHGAQNVRVMNMEFTDALEMLRTENAKVDFAFIDGNHRGEALLNYVRLILQMGDEIVIVADDIHLNRDMYRSWKILTESGMAEASVETNRFGILFRKNRLTPGKYKVWH